MRFSNQEHPYRAGKFVEWIKKIRANLPIPGVGISLRQTYRGTTLTLKTEDFWKHPWWMTPEWRMIEGTERSAWHVYVDPGFVNGRDVYTSRYVNGKTEYAALTDEQPIPIALVWRNPLLTQGADEAASFSLESIRLLSAEGYPAYFRDMGIKGAFKGGSIDELMRNLEQRGRQIRASDIVLSCPRIQTKFDIQIDVGNILANNTIVNVDPVWDDREINRREHTFTLRSQAKYEPPKEPTMMDRFMGTYVESMEDSLLIGTAWAVSPDGAPDEAEVDQSWELFFEYSCFWNLAHAAKNPPPDPDFQPIQLKTGLLNGFADVIFAEILAPLNAGLEGAHNALGQTTYQGRFWSV